MRISPKLPFPSKVFRKFHGKTMVRLERNETSLEPGQIINARYPSWIVH